MSIDYNRLAEKAVRNGMDPEEAARLSVEAESVIYSWLKGEERNAALRERNHARKRLEELSKRR